MNLNSLNIKFSDKVLFTKQLSLLLKAGIPIAECFDIISDQLTSTAFKKVLKQIQKHIENGERLSEALRKQVGVFDFIYISIIKIGENSGTLEENLAFLGGQLDRQYKLKQKIISASMYPTIVLITAFLVTMQISIFVMPKLLVLFESMDIVFPLSTRILIAFSKIMRDSGIQIFIAIIIVATLARLSLFIGKIKYTWELFLLNIPGVNKFIQNTNMALFCRNFGLMLKSGIPIVEAMSSIATSTQNSLYRKYFTEISTSLGKGNSLSDMFKNKAQFKHLPLLVKRLIGVGEKTGELDTTLLYLGDYFEDEIDNVIKNMLSILEPVLLFVIALVVGLIAISIISPIYQFSSSIQR